MKLPFYGGARLSPDCKKVIYLQGNINFDENDTRVNCYMQDISSGKRFKLTQSRVTNIQWIDNDSISFLRGTDNGKQIFVLENLVGESKQVSNHNKDIHDYQATPKGFFFLSHKEHSQQAHLSRKFGGVTHVDHELAACGLYLLRYSQKNFSSQILELSAIIDKNLNVSGFFYPSNHDSIIIEVAPANEFEINKEYTYYQMYFNPQYFDSEDLESKDENTELSSIIASFRSIVLPSGARVKAVSPNCDKIVYEHTNEGKQTYFQRNLFIFDIEESKTSNPEDITISEQDSVEISLFDQQPLAVYWTTNGIYVTFWEFSQKRICQISESNVITPIDLGDLTIEYWLYATENGQLSFIASSPKSMAHVYVSMNIEDKWETKQITQFEDHEQQNLDLGTSESITWRSKDGTMIEGVLRKPTDFDPKKKYPLIIYIHGGPAASSACAPVDEGNRFIYPEIQLLNKGILILKPNYRGSLGRGRGFLKLNVNNLGIGDQWDIESAIDHLLELGYIDADRIGAMGWSQGGYICSYLAFHSDRFCAISAGAALSNWYVYYSGSDNYLDYCLDNGPFDNPELYQKTAPISGYHNAKTPIMFIHGENDLRVPVISATEMYRALKEKNVPTELFIFKNRGHAWFIPIESYAVMLLNYRWFCHYFFGEEYDLLRQEDP